jgi:hypothetical protein
MMQDADHLIPQKELALDLRCQRQGAQRFVKRQSDEGRLTPMRIDIEDWRLKN